MALTSASVEPIIVTSSALSSHFCSLPGGECCHTPRIATDVPVFKLSRRVVVSRDFTVGGIHLKLTLLRDGAPARLAADIP